MKRLDFHPETKEMNTEDTVSVYCPALNEALKHAPNLIVEFSNEVDCPISPIFKDIEYSINKFWPMTVMVFAKKGNIVIGGIQSLVVPHMWNRGVTTSQEVFFWVRPENRGGSSASRMLRAHENELEARRTQLRSLCSLKSSPKGVERAYEKLGYKEEEKIFTKWMTRRLLF